MQVENDSRQRGYIKEGYNIFIILVIKMHFY